MKQTQNDEIQSTILIVDDDDVILDILSQTLKLEGYKILVATEGEMALKIAHRNFPDLILLDVLMPGIDGFETCRKLKQEEATQNIPVIFITAKDETEAVVEGFHAGGVDYIIKPFQREEVLTRIKTHLKISRLMSELRQKNRDLEREMAQRKAANNERNHLAERLSMISHGEVERWGLASIVGQSKTIQRLLEKISRLQTTGTTSVLITGESGTGKELVARAIHFESLRCSGPFIPVNCSAIPANLAESLLFGHVRGAFTDAIKNQKGYFALADGGTLFLDEIGDMPIEIQAKLMRVLEDGFVIPVGATEGKYVDVRILAATNTDLEKKMIASAFRRELYFRLAGFKIVVPPLREHKEDIPLLAEHFLKMFATEMGINVPPLSPEALEALLSYDFPGNVRELKNIIEYALIESGSSEIYPKHLHFIHSSAADEGAAFHSTVPAYTNDFQIHSSTPNSGSAAIPMPLNLEQAEIFLIKRTLAQTNGNVSEAARLLGTNRMRIYRALAREEKRIADNDGSS